MPRLSDARSEHIDAVFRESYALWGAGLGYDDYRAFWNELSLTRWARSHLRYYVWLDDDGVCRFDYRPVHLNTMTDEVDSIPPKARAY